MFERHAKRIMRFIPFVFLMLLAQTAAGRDQYRPSPRTTPPQQEYFYFLPRTAPPEGGAEIQFFANRFPFKFTAPQVFFDGVPSPHVTLVSADNFTAIAPAHAIGIVPVTVLDQGVQYISYSLFAFAPVLEEIIVPIAYKPIDASHGTRWVSEISVYNDSDDAIPIDPEMCSIIGTPVLCPDTPRRVPPHSSMVIPPVSDYAPAPEMFLLPPADHAGRLHFTVRLHELSRDPDGPGTEIPVIRERDLQQTQVWLPAVPSSARFRTTVRVYTRGLTVNVRVEDDTTGELLAELKDYRDPPTDIDPFRSVTLSDLLSPAQILAHKTVRYGVESDNPVWAMVTLTDNDTQRVQIYTPH
jgi:hypothetical protein